MSYLDFFCNLERQSDVIYGTCCSMCPDEEATMREKENMVHILEVWGCQKKLIKCFARSAADNNLARTCILRPYAVLRQTVEHLLLEVTKRDDVPPQCIYDFVNDRLRAVRQDMTIQRLPPEQVTQLLDPMIRFYVFYGYKLSHLPIKDYDPVLNKKHLMECLTWFLATYTDTDQFIDRFGNMSLKNKLQCDRVLMESLYLLCNLDNVQPLYRFLSLPKDLKCQPQLKLSFKITLANIKGNYVEVCRLMEDLCPLTYCAVYLYLPTLQRQALQVMSHAYNNKTLSVPGEAVRRWLRYESDADALSACRLYGLQVYGGRVKFLKQDFKVDVPTLPPRKLLVFEKRYDFSIENIFCYTLANKS